MTTCQTPECNNPVENRQTGLCASCSYELRRAERQMQKDARKRIAQLSKPKKQSKPIPKVSGKMAELLRQYTKDRDQWIKGKMCAVYPGMKATQCHHMRGRTGYADEWARQNNIPLLLDKRFWLPVSDDGHIKITNNSAWAFEKGFSLLRSN